MTRAARPPGELLLYGATGFSGRLIAQRACALGLSPILAGRDAARLGGLARELGCEARAVGLEDAARLAATLDGVAVLLNAAGPFTATTAPLVEACLAAGVHYLDISGEVPALAALARRHAQAAACGVMILPAVGFVVLPSDCLAAHVARRLPGATALTIAVSRTDALSRGSRRTILEQWGSIVAVRRNGVLTSVPIGTRERRVDFGRGARPTAAVSWGDVVTAFHTTGIPNIETYLEVSPAERALFRFNQQLSAIGGQAALRPLLGLPAALLGEGPSAQQRAGGSRVIVAEASDADGCTVRARLRTPEAYGFTALTAVAVAQRVLRGEQR
ncbi:MAG: saccharopine dehydrogenase NADP-binding domain-containing protein, partial [Deltaproteobacteria bacterium]|nr:saccharopine dehydrogenase NADP-binding domain-containing protein [Deltaproteobacteria bacterium]